MPITPLSIHKMRQNADTVGHWVFSEGSGTTLADASGGGNTGTLGSGAAAPTWVTTGRHRNALSFDGGDVVTVPHTAALNPGKISVLAWATTKVLGNYDAWVTKYTTGARYELLKNSNSGKAEFLVHNGTSLVEAVGTTVLSYDTWYFLVGTFDGVTARIYVNGVQEGSIALAGDMTGNTGDLGIGNRPAGGVPMQGLIDNVQIRNVAMTAAEIAAEFQRLTRVVLVG